MLLDKLWDDTMAGPHPERGLGKLRKLPTLNVTSTDGDNENKFQRSLSVPSSSSGSPGAPTTPTTPSTPTSARKVDVWRSVFSPGSNLNSRTVGAQIYDKPTHSSSPTVYDWLYSGDTKSRRA